AGVESDSQPFPRLLQVWLGKLRNAEAETGRGRGHESVFDRFPRDVLLRRRDEALDTRQRGPGHPRGLGPRRLLGGAKHGAPGGAGLRAVSGVRGGRAGAAGDGDPPEGDEAAGVVVAVASDQGAQEEQANRVRFALA
ncbi:unnamed protein product, partial [Ectocarpus sp. 13 AM-2016]